MASQFAALEYANAVELAGAEYRAARLRCEAVAPTRREACVTQAHAAEARTRAHAKSRFMGNSKSQLGARAADAEADYQAARQACADQYRPKAKCLELAKAERASALGRLQGATGVAVSAN
jgi:hypothetical protein